jgi:hypothetical protein
MHEMLFLNIEFFKFISLVLIFMHLFHAANVRSFALSRKLLLSEIGNEIYDVHPAAAAVSTT